MVIPAGGHGDAAGRSSFTRTRQGACASALSGPTLSTSGTGGRRSSTRRPRGTGSSAVGVRPHPGGVGRAYDGAREIRQTDATGGASGAVLRERDAEAPSGEPLHGNGVEVRLHAPDQDESLEVESDRRGQTNPDDERGAEESDRYSRRSDSNSSWSCVSLSSKSPADRARWPGRGRVERADCVGWIGAHAAAPSSSLNDCHPRPVYAYVSRYRVSAEPPGPPSSRQMPAAEARC